MKSIYPSTGKTYWALTTSTEEGIHKRFATLSPKLSLYIGAELGPSFSQSSTSVATGTSSSISVSFTSSLILTPVFAVSNSVSIMTPFKLIYVPASGAIPGAWNPTANLGLLITLGKK